MIAASAPLGALDALVEDAGINPDRTVVRVSDADWREVIAASLPGTFFVRRATARASLAAPVCGGPDRHHLIRRGAVGMSARPTTRPPKAGFVGS